MSRSALFVILTSLCCAGCDQYTKSLAREDLEPGQPVSYLGGFVRLQYEENAGGMLSVGSDLPESLRFWVFTVTVGLFLFGILSVVCIHPKLAVGDRFSGALIVGGGFGNLIDRLQYNGFVIDFLNIGLGPIRTAVFNLADVAVLSGAALLLVRHLRKAAT
ncbi:MAG: signal peptidase Aspartic peptidase, family [Bacteroidetes bacterium]|nr:signal peptidase Aspartic peptidase, family [Bacteroidota bacterium]